MLHEPRFSLPSDPRLIVCDMDGTLLDDDSVIPDELWGMLDQCRERGILFAVASGRQQAALARMFEERAPGTVYIAENGAIVVENGEVVSTTPLDRDTSVRLIHTAHALDEHYDIGLVWCGEDSAYVERGNTCFRYGAEPYYAKLESVESLLELDGQPLKVAFLALDGVVDEIAETIIRDAMPNRTLVSSWQWVDVMNPDADKAVGVSELQKRHGIRPDQTIVFGDFLNDLRMMSTTPYSYAMANAHPDVLEAAGHTAPPNTEGGVIQVLRQLFS